MIKKINFKLEREKKSEIPKKPSGFNLKKKKKKIMV